MWRTQRPPCLWYLGTSIPEVRCNQEIVEEATTNELKPLTAKSPISTFFSSISSLSGHTFIYLYISVLLVVTFMPQIYSGVSACFRTSWVSLLLERHSRVSRLLQAFFEALSMANRQSPRRQTETLLSCVMLGVNGNTTRMLLTGGAERHALVHMYAVCASNRTYSAAALGRRGDREREVGSVFESL